MIKKGSLFIILLFAATVLTAGEFRFLQQEGMRYRIVSEVDEGIWIDSQLAGQTEILNRIAVSILESDDDGALLEAEYSISEKDSNTGLYIYSQDSSTSFRRSHKGMYSQIPDDSALPSVRNIPVFPDNEVSQGESWWKEGEEVHDLKLLFGIDSMLRIPFRVYYSYDGQGEYDDRTVDIIRINYHFYQEIPAAALPLTGREEDYPIAVSGDFDQNYFWDPQAGIPAAVEDEFQISYMMASGTNYTFKGRSRGEVIEADHWNRESVKEDIAEAVEDMNDVSVSLNEEGVVLILDDIHFVPDSADFLPGEEEKLLLLKEILLKYDEHDLKITGHTARIRGGSADQGQALSEERAAAVAAFFLAEGVRDRARMLVEGKGSREPIGDNSREEGRRKNRRVEITILDN